MLSERQYTVYATAGYAHLQKRLFETNRARPILDQLPIVPGALARETFPDGERYYSFGEKLYRRRVLILGGSPNDGEFMELLRLAFGAFKEGAAEVNILDAYYGYSTMERAVKPGEIVTGKLMAHLKSSIPQAPDGTRWLNVDLHTEGLLGYYEGGTHAEHWYCQKLLSDAIDGLNLDKFVLGSTDLGRASWIKSYAKEHNVNLVLIDKRRRSGTDTTVERVIGGERLRGKDLVLFDDMFRTCGSAITAAQTYKSKGARRVYLIGTHGLFVGGAYAKLEKSRLFERIICTDTHPNTVKLERKGLQVVSIAPLILDKLRERDCGVDFTH